MKIIHRFKQLKEAACFLTIALCVTLFLASCEKKINEEPEPNAITVNISAIQGVIKPVAGVAPVTTITETEQYTGAVTWTPSVSGTFAAETDYTAAIILTAKSGYTFNGVEENFFTVEGATTVSNAANLGAVTAKFFVSVEASSISWKITDDGTLIISGTGEMPNYYDYPAPWYEYRSSITVLVIESGVTYIGCLAFDACSSLTSVTIPNSVISIGHSAFRDCSSLTTVNFNAVNCTDMGTELRTGIYGVFPGCSNLTTVNIGSEVTRIPHIAFYACSGLTSLTIPNSVTSIGAFAFAGCSGLTSITIPNSVTVIGYVAFGHCSALTSVTIPNSVISIEPMAFQNCSDLTSVTIPNSVASIAYGAFGLCSSLTEVINQRTTPQEIGATVFYDLNLTNCTLRVPATSVATYKDATYWKDFGNIVAIE